MLEKCDRLRLVKYSNKWLLQPRSYWRRSGHCKSTLLPMREILKSKASAASENCQLWLNCTTGSKSSLKSINGEKGSQV